MKIEAKLSYKSRKQNKKRTVYTIISIALCTFLIVTTIILTSTIKNGIAENITSQNNDYHFIIKNLSINDVTKIKNKEYIDKLFIQLNNKEELYEIKQSDIPLSIKENITVYLKYDNIKKVDKYSTDMMRTLNLSYQDAEEKCEFNQKVLNLYGLIDTSLVNIDYLPMAQVRVNFSYLLDSMIIVILFIFSVLSIVILYNSFLITINERKKQYAILTSIGATESQIIKIVFFETIVVGISGILIGGVISYLGTEIILKMINQILIPTSYHFRLIINAKSIFLALFIIIANIYLSAIIPGVKASSTSIMGEVKNNKQIKQKKKNSIIEKILPVEGRIALKNTRRDKNKYKVIIMLFVICLTSYIVVNTYISYEKEAADLINEYDIDAELTVDLTSKIDYQSILNNYTTKTGKAIEYTEYKIMGTEIKVEPESALLANGDFLIKSYEDNKKSIQMVIIGLEDKTYNQYIKKINGNYGDHIIYNKGRVLEGENEFIYKYYPVFNTKDNLKLTLIDPIYSETKNQYKIIDDKNINGNFILTEELVNGYKEMKNKFGVPTIFIKMDTYNKIEKNINSYYLQNEDSIVEWISHDAIEPMHIKVKCEDIFDFSSYIEEIKEKQNVDINTEYYSIQNEEKIIYINILQLILGIIIITTIIIGVTSAINIINASLSEREHEFYLLTTLGATSKNIKKMLISECIYMLLKATVISIILSIPIIMIMTKYLENVIVLSKMAIPISNICIFTSLLWGISLLVVFYSTKWIKSIKKD